MKIHRFISDFDFSKSEIKISNKETVSQIGNVLRLKKGEQILLCDGKTNEALSTIIEIKKDYVEVKIEKILKNENEPQINTALYCSILKRENFELVVQKATEVGIKEIVPMITRRTIKLNLNQERLEKIAKETAEQSERGVIPIIHKPINFVKAVEHGKQNNFNLFFDISGSQLKTNNYSLKTIGIWIGPEGGWDKEELDLVKDNNFEIVSLGKLTLRAETAAIIVSYLVSHSTYNI